MLIIYFIITIKSLKFTKVQKNLIVTKS